MRSGTITASSLTTLLELPQLEVLLVSPALFVLDQPVILGSKLTNLRRLSLVESNITDSVMLSIILHCPCVRKVNLIYAIAIGRGWPQLTHALLQFTPAPSPLHMAVTN